MPKCIELLPCDWLISNLCYQAIEQVYLIKWPVSVYVKCIWRNTDWISESLILIFKSQQNTNWFQVSWKLCRLNSWHSKVHKPCIRVLVDRSSAKRAQSIKSSLIRQQSICHLSLYTHKQTHTHKQIIHEKKFCRLNKWFSLKAFLVSPVTHQFQFLLVSLSPTCLRFRSITPFLSLTLSLSRQQGHICDIACDSQCHTLNPRQSKQGGQGRISGCHTCHLLFPVLGGVRYYATLWVAS